MKTFKDDAAAASSNEMALIGQMLRAVVKRTTSV
jgi:hypothetical protein